MLKADLYNFDGKKKEAVVLPKKYELKPNMNLLSQAIHVYEDRGHFGLARTKTRSEVAISTKKIYRQKGTGGARHGAKSAPIFVGGGTAHGPTGMKRTLHLSKSQRSRSLYYALKYKISDSMIVLADNLDKIEKTKDAAKLIKNIMLDRKWKSDMNVLLALSDKNLGAYKKFRNIKGVVVDYYKNLNSYKVFLAKAMIIDKEALEEKKDSSVLPVAGAGKENNLKKLMSKKSVGDEKVKINKTNIKRKVSKVVKSASAKTIADKARKTKK